MRIDSYPRPIVGARSGTAAKVSGGTTFTPTAGAAPAGRAAGAAPVQSAAPLDAILALQGVDDALQGRRKAVRRGRDLLDTLDAIKSDLLGGQVDAERLDSLSDQVSQLRERSHPGLDAVLDDIELRVRVELAKAGRYPA